MSADALKTFEAGEDILASDTNDNNTYILNQITTSANQLNAQIDSLSTNVSNITNSLGNYVNISGTQTVTGNKTYSAAQTFNNTITFPICETAAETTSTASRSRLCVVIKNYKNGGSWYREYSDGWVEQGGEGTGNFDVTFLIEMADTHYTRWVTGSARTNTQSGHNYMHSYTTTGAKVRGIEESGQTTAWGIAGYKKVTT